MNDKEEIYTQLWVKLLHFIAHSPRTEFEINKKITTLLDRYKKIDSGLKYELREMLIQNVKDDELVNDEKYASEYIQMALDSSKPRTKIELSNFLRRKGINPDLIEQSLNEYNDEHQEESIKKIIRKKRFINKLQAIKYLTQRGFDSYLVHKAVNELEEVD